MLENKIAEYRKNKKLTQQDLADMVGIQRPYLSDLENSKYEPGGLLMLKIAKALCVDVNKIFFINNVQYKEQIIDAETSCTVNPINLSA